MLDTVYEDIFNIKLICTFFYCRHASLSGKSFPSVKDLSAGVHWSGCSQTFVVAHDDKPIVN